ncbi:phosphoethanolamine--lipid A transferase [Aquabacterium sp. A7-Y]|uniref:phosphoethanolamine transferase n=1 Tax=Aquabacterium sp. A7-Y TaxID=1349605 RepID=UPI00223D1661|nr:phosphoethanolamine--lipid A transferase [Aquabacterium sp. A7-Y]MCW7538726.1 phosphoethanolamine--lipid A transferase [Aquabacterium sp. A7-Y]
MKLLSCPAAVLAPPGLLLPARRPMSQEGLALCASLWFTLVSNASFWHGVLEDRSLAEPATWGVLAACGIALTLLQFAGLCLLLGERWARPLLAALLVATACGAHFMQRLGIVLDSSMLRNVLATDWKEARELLSFGLLETLAWQAALPAWLLYRTPLLRRGWRRAATRRLLALWAALLVAALAMLLVFQDLSGLMRNHKALRYQIMPGTYVHALARLVKPRQPVWLGTREPIGTDARLGPAWQPGRKPVLFMLVVGETVRAANWGLNGYARQTTPELAALDVVNFAEVSTCGTNTEVSLPCMFSPWGRRDYDEQRILSHESLLHVLRRAGLRVTWRDNQSGCKGVCDGLTLQQLDSLTTAGLCTDGLCLDEILLQRLEGVATDPQGNQVVVLHELGNHGPAYFKRYPAAFRRYLPTCDSTELRNCTREQIVNSYDNALLYGDHVLGQAIRRLQEAQSERDTALLYVSDHGESLGENGLYLHGLPYAIAPAEQTRVPMVMWFSRGYAERFGVDPGCLKDRARRPASHDHLFHTVLGLLDVRTKVYDAEMDLSAGCRTPAAARAGTPIAVPAAPRPQG